LRPALSIPVTWCLQYLPQLPLRRNLKLHKWVAAPARQVVLIALNHIDLED
jgi:hypothetical protein